MKEWLANWKFDWKTAVVTALLMPVGLVLLRILKRTLKEWGAYALEGVIYWVSRRLKQSLARSLTLKAYCRSRLAGESRFLYVPSSLEVKLDIDRVFVTLTLEAQSADGKVFHHQNLLTVGNRLRVMGDPGSGKSSLVKRLFRDACVQAMQSPKEARLPLILELKNLVIPKNTSEGKLGDWLFNEVKSNVIKVEAFEMAQCFDTYVKTAGLLVLLDGLDEVSSSNYPRVEKAIIALGQKLGEMSENNVVVLTMRTQFHQQVKNSFRNTFGQALFLKPFSPTDIYSFLRNWPFKAGADQHIARIYGELTDRPTLREMCSNPLVLGMYVAEDQAAGHVVAPESRTEFYSKVTEELVIKRRLQQTGATPAHGKLREQRERILGRLAYDHMLDANQSANSLDWQAAMVVVKNVFQCTETEAAERFRELSKETGLVTEERTAQSFRFIHLTFCEFFAAFEAVQGQSGGWERLIEAHTGFMANQKKPQLATRLIEVIPFASGLMTRSKRNAAITDISKLGDQGLLARCFLETKCYDHAHWKDFVEGQKRSLLSVSEARWDEQWLRELHLFNILVRDAVLCATHSPTIIPHVDLDAFFQTLVGQQRESIAKLLAAYAKQDAAAAFRLAEISNLDLIGNFPEIVVTHCDQRPFLALLLEQVAKTPSKAKQLSHVLVEGALRSPVVAQSLFTTEPSEHYGKLLDRIEKKRIWYYSRVFPISLYTQMITLSTSDAPQDHKYPLLHILSSLQSPAFL